MIISTILFIAVSEYLNCPEGDRKTGEYFKVMGFLEFAVYVGLIVYAIT